MISVSLYCCATPGCGKSYRSKVSLKRHVDTIHYHIRDFACEICGDTFVTKQNLDEHIFLHSGKKLFACELCDASFKQKNQLALHLRKHRRAHLVVARQKPPSKAEVRELEIKELFSTLVGEDPSALTPTGETEQPDSSPNQ